MERTLQRINQGNIENECGLYRIYRGIQEMQLMSVLMVSNHTNTDNNNRGKEIRGKQASRNKKFENSNWSLGCGVKIFLHRNILDNMFGFSKRGQ